MPGKDGLSAYELFKKYNPDSKLTEEEYAETPVQAAGVALAMVEQLEETDAAVKQAEQLREQAEQGREASERTRATAEQERVAAEQQRTLAEQTRVTNESARQTAEAGRQTAETKREENTAEAIRNSEEATRKAEDEAPGYGRWRTILPRSWRWTAWPIGLSTISKRSSTLLLNILLVEKRESLVAALV